MIKHREDIINLKNEVVKKFGIGPSKMWRNRDFENLSFEINKKTGVLISNATLKRIFGKSKTSEYYFPQNATLQALCEYSEFTVSEPPKKKTLNYTILGSVALISVLTIGLFLFWGYKKNSEPIETNLEIKTIENTFQTSLQFKYEIPKKSDSLFLFLGEGEKPIYLDPSKTILRHFLRFPGYFKSYIANKDRSYTSEVKSFLLKTEGWQSIAYHFDENPVKRYYPIPENFWMKEKMFGITARKLSGCGIDTTKITAIRFENYKETFRSGDNFELNAELQSCEYWPAISCYSIYTTVVCENGKINIKTSDIGCSAYSEYTISEKRVVGSRTDLSDLCLNIHDPFSLNIKNNNKTVSFRLNNKTIISSKYIKSLGNIKGVSIEFHGTGSVNFITLKGSDGEKIF